MKTTANIVCIASKMNREDSENGVGILFSTVNTSNMRNRPFSKSFLFQSEPGVKSLVYEIRINFNSYRMSNQLPSQNISYLESPSNRDWGEFGNGLLVSQLRE